MDWRNEVVAKLIEFEGKVPHMYLDSVGLVTVGVGNLLETAEEAAKLAFVDRGTGQPAPRDEIRAEHAKLAAMEQDNYAAGYFRQHTSLNLPDEAIEASVLEHLHEFEEGLRNSFAGFDAYPDQAKKGVMDMVFNLGLNGLLNKFPSFSRGFRDRRWQACHDECNRRGIAKARNDYVRSLFTELIDARV